jgi:hypothetical protein
VVAAVVVYIVWLPVSVRHDRTAFVADASAVRTLQVGWLMNNSGPGDTVLVDDQTLAVGAHRLVPPALTDTSTVRRLSGYLPLPVLTGSTTSSSVRAILLTRTLRDDPTFVQWLRTHYREVPLPSDYAALAFVAKGS